MKAYKGFNKDLTCRGFQYEVGKEYEHNGKVVACESGFHACENPLDCFGYYTPGQSVFHEVELSGKTSKHGDDSKVAASHIKIGARLDVMGICKAHFEYVRSRCTNEDNVEAGKPAAAGFKGSSAAGNYGSAAAGNYGSAAAGNYGSSAAGFKGSAAAGFKGSSAAGDYGSAASRGKSSSGKYGLSVARGNNVKVRGGLGAVLVIAEENDSDYEIKEWKVAVVDGERIKADTWYQLKDGEFQEVD